jgi:membrane-bound lytic murein transglycosylase D
MKTNYIGALALALVLSSSMANADDEKGIKPERAVPAVEAPALPKAIAFADEAVPLQNFDTYESLEREILVNTFWHSQTIFNLKQASRYFAQIEPILKANNVPDDIKYIAVAESSLQNVVSPAKAAGPWQILEGTAKQYGLEVNENVDERYNIEKATEAAISYLKKAKDSLGSWTLAAASYNIGLTGLKRHMNRQQQASYYDLLLGDETGRYVFRILAFKIILNDPKAYGFDFGENDRYPELQYTEVKVDYAIDDLASFAIANKTSYKLLKLYNPWLRSNILPKNEGKTYIIKLPKEGFRENAYKQR